MQTFVLAAIAFPILVALDLLWMLLAGNLYRMQLGSLLREEVLWSAALAFYAVYVLALSYLALMPSLRQRSLRLAIISAAFFGASVYGAYNFMNMATILLWPAPLAALDILWGVLMTVAAAAVTYLIATRMLKY